MCVGWSRAKSDQTRDITTALGFDTSWGVAALVLYISADRRAFAACRVYESAILFYVPVAQPLTDIYRCGGKNAHLWKRRISDDVYTCGAAHTHTTRARRSFWRQSLRVRSNFSKSGYAFSARSTLLQYIDIIYRITSVFQKSKDIRSPKKPLRAQSDRFFLFYENDISHTHSLEVCEYLCFCHVYTYTMYMILSISTADVYILSSLVCVCHENEWDSHLTSYSLRDFNEKFWRKTLLFEIQHFPRANTRIIIMPKKNIIIQKILLLKTKYIIIIYTKKNTLMSHLSPPLWEGINAIITFHSTLYIFNPSPTGCCKKEYEVIYTFKLHNFYEEAEIRNLSLVKSGRKSNALYIPRALLIHCAYIYIAALQNWKYKCKTHFIFIMKNF